MSEQDSFIQEVTEEVRKDRMFAVWKKYGPYAIAAVVLVILGTLGYDQWNKSVANKKGALGGQMISAANLEEPADAAAAFEAVANEGEYGYPALARLRAASSYADAGNPDKAAELYEAIAADNSADQRLRDLATLRFVMLRFDMLEPADIRARLAPLMLIGSPWRTTALEFEAASYIREDNPTSAAASLEQIINDTEIPAGTSIRARQVRQALLGLSEGIDEETSDGEYMPVAGHENSENSGEENQ